MVGGTLFLLTCSAAPPCVTQIPITPQSAAAPLTSSGANSAGTCGDLPGGRGVCSQLLRLPSYTWVTTAPTADVKAPRLLS